MDKNQQEIEEQEKIDKKEIIYKDKEQQYRDFLIERLERAKDQMGQNYPELDDMTRYMYYDTNAKAANSYNAPTMNVEDKRIVTGTTLEKDNALLNSVLNLNLEPDIESYSKDDLPIQAIGEAVQAMVRKSRKMEGYDDKKRRLYYKELIDQGNVFVEDLIIDRKCVEKELKTKEFNPGKLSSIQWTERISKTYKECESNMIHGCKVFLGNIKEFFIDKQPYLFTLEYIDKGEAKAIYGEWERWDNVPEKVKATVSDDEISTYNDWRLLDIHSDLIEVIKYQDKWANEYMIMLNGVMMLPTGFPLSAVTGDGEYSIIKGDLEPINRFFALSKSFPAKCKVPQAVLDEFTRLLVLKTQQSAKPPMTNTSNKVLSRKIFNPGTITPGIAKDQLNQIGNNAGVTQSELAAIEYINGVIDNMSVSSQFSSGEGDAKTATQATLDQRQNLLKIGLAVLGIIAFEKDLTKRRIVNILRAWTEPIDSEIDKTKKGIVDSFRTITSDAEFQGKRGLRMVKMTEDNTMTDDEIMQEEDEYSDMVGKPVRITYIRPSMLKTIKNKWYIEITPTEKETSELKKATFKQDIADTMAIFGPEAVNREGLKPRWAQVLKEDEDVLFVEGQESMQMMGGQAPEVGGNIQPPQRPTTQSPTINSLEGAM